MSIGYIYENFLDWNAYCRPAPFIEISCIEIALEYRFLVEVLKSSLLLHTYLLGALSERLSLIRTPLKGIVHLRFLRVDRRTAGGFLV